MFDFSRLGVRPGSCDVLVDVGANAGQFLFPALAYFQPRQALAIEMLEDFARELERDPRMAAPGRAVVHCAAGARSGSLECLRSVHAEASSLLPIHPDAGEWYGMDLRQFPHGEVPVRKLDDICAAHGIASIDLLKIDVQGYELEVIRGAGRVLRRTRSLIIEVEFVPVYPGQALFDEITSELGMHGLRFVRFVSEYRSPAGKRLHADALFRPSIWRKLVL